MYDVHSSGLPESSPGFVLHGIIISGGKFVTDGVQIAVGIKDKALHVSREGYVPKLKWISTKSVVLWDEEEKRGWLVNGASALLHLTRASLELNKTDAAKSVFLFNF